MDVGSHISSNAAVIERERPCRSLASSCSREDVVSVVDQNEGLRAVGVVLE
jgi:hypothetical protein